MFLFFKMNFFLIKKKIIQQINHLYKLKFLNLFNSRYNKQLNRSFLRKHNSSVQNFSRQHQIVCHKLRQSSWHRNIMNLLYVSAYLFKWCHPVHKSFKFNNNHMDNLYKSFNVSAVDIESRLEFEFCQYFRHRSSLSQ